MAAFDPVRADSRGGQPLNKLSLSAGYLYNHIDDPKGLSFHLVEVGVLSPADQADINEERGDFKARACLVRKLLYLSDEKKVCLFEDVLSKEQPLVAAGMAEHQENLRLKLDSLARRGRSPSETDADSGVSTRFLSPTDLSAAADGEGLPRKGFVDEIVNQMLSRVNMSEILPVLADKGFLTTEETRVLWNELEGHEHLARANLFFMLFHRKSGYELSHIINIIIETKPDVLQRQSERGLLHDFQTMVTEPVRRSPVLEDTQTNAEGVASAASAQLLSAAKAPPESAPVSVPRALQANPLRKDTRNEEGKAKSLLVVLGASSAGKSTLLNNLFGDDLAEVGSSVFGTTKAVSVYTQSIGEAELQIADTVGYSGTTPVDPATKDDFPLGADSGDVRHSGLVLFCSQVTDSPHIQYADRLAIKHLKNEYGADIFDHFIVVLTKANLLLEKKREDYKTFIQALTEGWYKMLVDLLGEAVAGRIRVVAAGKNPGERLCEVDWYSELWLSCSEYSSQEHSRALWQIATAKGKETRRRGGSIVSSSLQIPDHANLTTPTPTRPTDLQQDSLPPGSESSNRSQPVVHPEHGFQGPPQSTENTDQVIELPNRGGPPVSVRLSTLTKWLLDTAGDRRKPGVLDNRTLPVAILIAAAQGAVIGGTAGALVGFGVGAGAGVFVGILAGVLLYLFRKYNLDDTTTTANC